MGAGSNLEIELNGPNPGTGYDQLNVTGTVTLDNPELLATLGFTPSPGEKFIIINNDGIDPVIGMFDGLPDFATFSIGGQLFQITYEGGDGNDVTLTVVTPVPIVLSGFQRSFDTQSVFSYSADVGLRYAVERSTTLSNWTTIWSNTANFNPMTFTDTGATNRMNFYRVRRLADPP